MSVIAIITGIIIILLLFLNVVFLLWLFEVREKLKNPGSEELKKLSESTENLEKLIKDEFARNREETAKNSRETREELSNSLMAGMKGISEMQKGQLDTFANLQKGQFETFSKNLVDLTKSNEERMEKMRETIETRIRHLQEDNSKKLDEMRNVVDEKLQTTLEKRLGESFKQVSERLEAVYKGLGEMQTLASGVGDLKKVLSNVKTKGVLGEYQLENILEQLLTPQQYAKNVKTKEGSSNLVEFAVKLPGREDPEKVVWLPLDAKFPSEDYQNLMDAYEAGDINLIGEYKKNLALKIRSFAKDIRDKYIDPPNTTDFAIMFLPFEGLYAEILREPGLFESIQRDLKIIITGPTTLSALLNSLQMGFRTLAIEKRSSEVWELLGAVKTEFRNFGEVLDKTRKKLQEASNVIETAGTRSRAIERKLRNVTELPQEKASKLIGSADQNDILNDETEEETPSGLF